MEVSWRRVQESCVSIICIVWLLNGPGIGPAETDCGHTPVDRTERLTLRPRGK